MSNGKSQKSERAKNNLTRIAADVLTGSLFGVKIDLDKTKKHIDEIEDLEKKLRMKIDECTEKSYNLRQDGFNTDVVEDYLNESRMHLENMEFREAAQALRDAKQKLEIIPYPPFPLLDKDIAIVTVVKPTENKIICNLRLVNRENEATGDIIIKPTVPNGFKEVTPKRLGNVEAKGSETLQFELTPTKDVTEGSLEHFLIDKKIEFKSTMMLGTEEERKNIITIKNVSDRHIQNLRIRPMIPESVSSEFPYRDIDLLKSNKKRKVSFTLRPRE